MLRLLTKGWYLCCYKYWTRNLNVHHNIYSRERSFIFKGNSKIQFNHNKTNKQRQLFWCSSFYLKITFKIKSSRLSNRIRYCSSLLRIKNISRPNQWIICIIPALKCHIFVLPVPKKGQFFRLKKTNKQTNSMRTSTAALSQWDFGYAEGTGNKYREAKGAIWDKCFLSSEQYLFAGALCHTTIYHS